MTDPRWPNHAIYVRVTAVHSDGLRVRFTARCRCGWEGQLMTTRSDALAEGASHKQDESDSSS